jgi:DNA helicase-2/ATP-dependent DNA helicase PcrA
VVARNLEREPKRLWTDNADGDPVTAIACDDDRDEANLVTHAFQMLSDGGYAKNDIALLYRKHSQSRVFEEALRRINVPYRVIGGLRFYDRAEVKDLLAYLRAVHNPADDVSVLRIINKPARGIGKTTLDRLIEAASRAGSSVHAALLAAVNDEAQPAATRKKLQAFAELLAGLQKHAAEGPAVLAKQVLESTGYVEELRAEDTVEADSRIENILEVLSSMEQYQADTANPTLTEFLEQVTLETDADRTQVADSITLMTVHAAKGLEFPVVFVAGLEEETFPHRGFQADEDPEDLEEERRLCYVAFTRARERLFVSYARTRRIYNEVKLRQPSRFLHEIPRDEVHWVGAGRDRKSAAPAAQPRSRSVAAAHSGPYVDRSEANDTLDSGIQPGMRVRHTKFGVGRVTAVADGVPPRVTVDFPDGSRSIVSSYLTPV